MLGSWIISYFKPTEEQILEDYLKVVTLQTISNENKLQKEIDAGLKEKYDRLETILDRIDIVEKELEKRGINIPTFKAGPRNR